MNQSNSADPDSSSSPDQRHQQQSREIEAALLWVSSGRIRSVSISGLDFEGVSPQLRQAAAERGLQLDLERLTSGGWSAKISPQVPHPDERVASTFAGSDDWPQAAPAPVAPVVLSRRVLLVEDDPTLARFIKLYLEGHGIAVQVAESEEAAELALAAAVPGLLLLDINLPGRTGWSLLYSPAYQAAGRPAVVIVSATNVRADHLVAGSVSGYLPKPFGMPVLLATVERILGGSGSQLSKSPSA